MIKSQQSLKTHCGNVPGMEKQLSAQKAALTEQAKAQRGELQKLNEKNAAEAGIWARLEKIVSVKNAIDEIGQRFDAAIAKMEKEVNALYGQQKSAVRAENPKEPFETQEEYETLIRGMEGSIEGKRKAELNRRRSDAGIGHESAGQSECQRQIGGHHAGALHLAGLCGHCEGGIQLGCIPTRNSPS